jgi:hypothetical protein
VSQTNKKEKNMPYPDDYKAALAYDNQEDMPHDLENAADTMETLRSRLKEALDNILDVYIFAGVQEADADESFIAIVQLLNAKFKQLQKECLSQFEDTNYECEYKILDTDAMLDYANDYVSSKQNPKTVIVANAGNAKQVNALEVL